LGRKTTWEGTNAYLRAQEARTDWRKGRKERKDLDVVWRKKEQQKERGLTVLVGWLGAFHN